MTGDELERVLGHRFEDRALLEAALTHPSVGRQNSGRYHYERLEFLGDRVLGLVIAELLLTRYPTENEGALTRRLVALVRREAVLEVAHAIGLDRFLRASAAASGASRRERETALADGCEALIGALYLDGGLEAAASFIRRAWTPLLEAAAAPAQDAKTALQEWAQARGLPLPAYKVVVREGPAHRPAFTVEARVAGSAPAIGTGGSKRAAEQIAAAALLERLRAEHDGG